MKHIQKFNEGKEERKKAILDQIAKKQAELDALENGKREGIIPLEEYTNEQKIEYFDSLYKFAIGIVEEKEDSGYASEDNDHWAFEETMKILNIKNPREFWNYYNSLD